MAKLLPVIAAVAGIIAAQERTGLGFAAVGAVTVAAAAIAAIAEYACGRKYTALGKIDVRGKCVVVTGAGTGIGKAIAEDARTRGAHVVLCGRRLAPLEQVAATLGGSAHTTVVADCDVTKEADVQRLLAAALATTLPIAVVVLNAGRSCCGEIDDTKATMDNAREMMELNYFANVRLSQLFLPALKAARGSFLVVSSLSGLFATYRGNAYTAAKHALNGYFDVLRLEQHRYGVSVTIMCPGYVISDIHTSQLTVTGEAPPVRDRSSFMSAEYVAEKAMTATLSRRPKIVLPVAARIPYVLRSVLPRVVEAVITRGVLKTYGDDGTRTLREIAASKAAVKA